MSQIQMYNPGLSYMENLSTFPELYSSDKSLRTVPKILLHYKERLSLLHNSDDFRYNLIDELSEWIRTTNNMNVETFDKRQLASFQKELNQKNALLSCAQSPKDFSTLVRSISTLHVGYQNQITDLVLLQDIRNYFNDLYDDLVNLNLYFDLSGRRKALVPFGEKLLNNALAGKTPSSLKDIFAFRIVLFDTEDTDMNEICYQVMEHIIDFFEEHDCLLDDPSPLKDICFEGNIDCEPIRIQKVKDYIKYPKKSGYQSLHALFVTLKGYYFEIQVRTLKMHLVAEKGEAAHDGIYKTTQYNPIVPNICMQGFEFIQEKNQQNSDTDAVYIYMDKSGILHSINILNRQRTF